MGQTAMVEYFFRPQEKLKAALANKPPQDPYTYGFQHQPGGPANPLKSKQKTKTKTIKSKNGKQPKRTILVP